MIWKTHTVAQKPRRRQLNVKVCGSESALFYVFFLSLSTHHNFSTKLMLPQHGALRPLSVFIASILPWSIKVFTALPGCCPLRRTPFSNLVCMHACCLVSRPMTTVIGVGVRLVHVGNHALTSMAVSTAGMVSSVVVERAHGHHVG